MRLFGFIAGVVVFWMVAGVAYGKLRGTGVEMWTPENSAFAVNASSFTNYVDHFDHSNKQTFEQRYWYTLHYWNKTAGPILFFLCGESAGHFPAEKSFIMELANKTQAAVVALEHRYYGYSIPTPDLSLDNLKYLSHDQALADYACFIKVFSRMIKAMDHPVVVIGGSYAGALAAWMRYKYPDLVVGAYSSSGVVNSILDFSAFDDQVKRSVQKSGPECEATIHKLFDEAKASWASNPWKLKIAHGAPYLEWDDFMFYFADIFVEAVQYGQRTSFCKFLKEIENDPERQAKLAQYALDNRASPESYAFEHLRTTQINPFYGDRQWTYQYCSALGYLNTPGSGDNPLRFKEMTLEYWRRYCAKVFGAPVFPDPTIVNRVYGDVRIAKVISNTIFTNGGEDPWQWAGVRR